jgi:hypothetical protein
MRIKDEKEIDMDQHVYQLLLEYGVDVPCIHNLALLGQRAVKACGKWDDSKIITFHEICECIKVFISTPFGEKILRGL